MTEDRLIYQEDGKYYYQKKLSSGRVIVYVHDTKKENLNNK